MKKTSDNKTFGLNERYGDYDQIDFSLFLKHLKTCFQIRRSSPARRGSDAGKTCATRLIN